MIFLIGEYGAYDQTCNPYAGDGFEDGYFYEIVVSF